MLRLLVGSVVVAGSFVAVVPAAPRPADAKKSEHYYPTRRGDVAVYEPPNELFRKMVDSADVVNGVKVVTTEVIFIKRGVPIGSFETVRVTAAGLFRVEKPGQADDASECVMKVPVGKKAEWETGRAKYVATGPEEVRVPAGRFDAIKVVSEEAGPPKVTTTRWYALDVGVVKQSTRVGEGPAVDVVLKWFTPGKP